MDQRFDQHGSPNAIYHAGGVLDFIFGLKIPPKDIHEAERMILAKLTELGFFWPIATETGGRRLPLLRRVSVSSTTSYALCVAFSSHLRGEQSETALVAL
ncbi:hypothetical protein P3T76_010035 [Phytophthora citrophthora]|uniref:Uncharacterized protein n=1 Tax=Phytophthora citrophthora TaxID=4793 RepID=A0AAD9GE97_9STRA|nr:hypothetical protein P3T76_010035 [Phytophthora citrophthora]